MNKIPGKLLTLQKYCVHKRRSHTQKNSESNVLNNFLRKPLSHVPGEKLGNGQYQTVN